MGRMKDLHIEKRNKAVARGERFVQACADAALRDEDVEFGGLELDTDDARMVFMMSNRLKKSDNKAKLLQFLERLPEDMVKVARKAHFRITNQ